MAGTAFLTGCAPTGVRYNYVTLYNVGDIVYFCAAARKGCLEVIEIRDMRLVSNQHGVFFVYLDKENWAYNPDELCSKTSAEALAIAYWQSVITSAQDAGCN